MSTSSLQRRDQKTAQYLGWKEQSEDSDERWRRQLIAQLSYLLDDATLQAAPLWQLRKWTANGTATAPAAPVANTDDLLARIEALRKVFDKAAVVEVEPVQPTVEIDQQAVAEANVAYQASYSDMFGGPVQEFEGATNDDFDEQENYIYRAVSQ